MLACVVGDIDRIDDILHTMRDLLIVAIRPHPPSLGTTVGIDSFQQLIVEVVQSVGISVDSSGPTQVGGQRTTPVDSGVGEANVGM